MAGGGRRWPWGQGTATGAEGDGSGRGGRAERRRWMGGKAIQVRCMWAQAGDRHWVYSCGEVPPFFLYCTGYVLLVYIGSPSHEDVLWTVGNGMYRWGLAWKVMERSLGAIASTRHIGVSGRPGVLRADCIWLGAFLIWQGGVRFGLLRRDRGSVARDGMGCGWMACSDYCFILGNVSGARGCGSDTKP